MDVARVSMSRQDILGWAAESVAFCEIDLSRVSTVFLAQAYASEKGRIFSTFDLTNPIKVLEGLAKFDGTPPAEQFKHPPLSGLYKKHFSSPRFLVKNLLNFQRSKEGKKHFEKAWKDASALSDSGVINEQFIAYLTHQMTIPPIQIKSTSNAMTGEWVVFHKHEGVNFYLTLASHGESNEEIYERVVLACSFDGFPFKL